MKVTREEFDKFWDDVFGQDWFDDSEVDWSSYTSIELDDLVLCAYTDEPSLPKSGVLRPRDIDGIILLTKLETIFKRWRKAQNTTVIVAVFECPNDVRAQLQASIERLGGRIKSV